MKKEDKKIEAKVARPNIGELTAILGELRAQPNAFSPEERSALAVRLEKVIKETTPAA